MSALSTARVVACSTCKAAMVWAFSPSGRRLPIDAAPVEMGEYRIAGFRGSSPTLAHALATDTERYTSHFRTCRDASMHSRRGKAGSR